MRSLKTLFASLALLLAFSGVGLADLITFEDLEIDRLDQAGPLIEGAFTYEATQGEGWELQPFFGNPASALVTFFNDEGALAGDMVDITLTGGGAFTFSSVDIASIAGSATDQVTIFGYLGGVEIGSLLLSTTSTSFVTIASSFSGPIDLLRLKVTVGGASNALIIDNIQLTTTAVPEPASLAMLTAGGLGLFVRRRRRARIA